MKKMNFLVAIATVCVCFLSGCGMRRQMYGPYYPPYPAYQQPTQPTAAQPALSTTTQPTSEQSTLSAAQKRTVKSGPERRLEIWEEGGYTLSGDQSFYAPYDLLVRHYNKVEADPERYISVMGVGKGADLATARYSAQFNASTTYATSAGSVIAGGMAGSHSSFSEEGMKTMGAYTQKVRDYLTPEIKESFFVYRKVPVENKVKYEVEAYYLIDEQRASKIRKQAMDEALKETATEQIFGTAVDEWVKEFVSVDEE